MKNADRIRELPDEVLAQIIRWYCVGSTCKACSIKPICHSIVRTADEWYDWLESEAEE